MCLLALSFLGVQVRGKQTSPIEAIYTGPRPQGRRIQLLRSAWAADSPVFRSRENGTCGVSANNRVSKTLVTVEVLLRLTAHVPVIVDHSSCTSNCVPGSRRPCRSGCSVISTSGRMSRYGGRSKTTSPTSRVSSSSAPVSSDTQVLPPGDNHGLGQRNAQASVDLPGDDAETP